MTEMTFRKINGDRLASLAEFDRDTLPKALGFAVLAGLLGEGNPPDDVKRLLAMAGVEVDVTETGSIN